MTHDPHSAAWSAADDASLLAPPGSPGRPAAGWEAVDFASDLQHLLHPATESEDEITTRLAASPTRSHRRPRRRLRWPARPEPVRWLRWASLLMGAAASVLVAMLSVLGGLISYAPLRHVASPALSGTLTAWWPMLIYGPWLVASLSILRAALHQRRAVHSWMVVILFSGVAVALCVLQAPPTPTGMAVVGLPPVSALVAFHQVVRQLTLLNPPRHAMPRGPATAGAGAGAGPGQVPRQRGATASRARR